MSGRLQKALLGLVVLAVAGIGIFWLLTTPRVLTFAELPDHTADAQRGRTIFLIGGCAACHAVKDAKDEARLVLRGGLQFKTDFGTLTAPNISTDRQTGIGGWSALDFVNAMQRGVSPEGRHYYPAFPYTSYARMRTADILDLWAYLQSLPASAEPSQPHELSFPFTFRRGLGLWKLLFLDPSPVLQPGEPMSRGQYLVEGPGHCGECHTPRNPIGGPDLSRWLGGASSLDGPGRIPDITPSGRATGKWSAEDIAEYLKSGFTPNYDTAGGSMVDVIENTSRLEDVDRMAIADYLKSVPPAAP